MNFGNHLIIRAVGRKNNNYNFEITANEPMLKEVAVLKHKTMNEAIQFDNRKMFERSGEPAISFNNVLPAAASTSLSTKHKKTNNNFLWEDF